jgi:hypothetical protein
MNTTSRDKFALIKARLKEQDLAMLDVIEDIETCLNADGVHISFHICNDVWWSVRNILTTHPGGGLLQYKEKPIRLAGREIIRQFLTNVKNVDIYALAIDAYLKELQLVAVTRS